jgi:hypothetical protein
MFKYFSDYPDLRQMLIEQYEEIHVDSFNNLYDILTVKNTDVRANNIKDYYYRGKPVYSVEFDGAVFPFMGDISSTACLATCRTDEPDLYDNTYVVTIKVKADSEQTAINLINIDPDIEYSILKI